MIGDHILQEDIEYFLCKEDVEKKHQSTKKILHYPQNIYIIRLLYMVLLYYLTYLSLVLCQCFGSLKNRHDQFLKCASGSI